MNRLLTTIAFLFTFVVSGQVLAAETEANGPVPDGPVIDTPVAETLVPNTPATSSPVPASREEYRACLDLQVRLKAQLESLDGHVAENNNRIALLRADAMALAERHQNMSPSDPSQFEAFNKQLEMHNSNVVAASEQAERVKEEREAYHLRTVEYNKICSTLVVRLEDRDAVLNERNNSGKVSIVAH